jgi:CDP-4-dehydro-6-deoxyglucose reductase, E3
MRITVLRDAPARPASPARSVPPARAALECAPDETVLSALARQGVALPSACQAGVCRACLVRALAGDPGAAGAAGLEDALRADGYFLACQARPAGDLVVALDGADLYTPARLLSVRREAAGLRVKVAPERPLAFAAGQHVAVRVPAGGADLVRVYSFASRPADAARDGVEFYVRRYPGGAMGDWLAAARPGAGLSLGRPSGTCCYRPGEPDAPLLLAGTGTGLAPLAAIARDALAHGHRGPIVVLRGAAGPGGLYPEQYLPPPPARVRTCLQSRGEDLVAAVVAEYAAVMAAASGASGSGASGSGAAASAPAQAFLCGGAGVVARMRRALFLAGQSLRDIHLDPFTAAVTTAAATSPAGTRFS